jgi:hypothetical protein
MWKQADVVRAHKALGKAGLPVLRTEIAPDGRIIPIHVGVNAPTAYDEWMASNGSR